MLRVFLLILGLISAVSTEAQTQPETRSITDDLFIYLHAGPSNQYKILGSVTAGSQVDFISLDEETQYAQIIDNKGREGWVEYKFLQTEPSIRQSIEQLQQQLQQANELIEQLQSNPEQQQLIDDLTIELNQTKQKHQALADENVTLQQSLIEKDQSLQMEWLMKGGGVVFFGIVIGVILCNLPKRRRSEQWM